MFQNNIKGASQICFLVYLALKDEHILRIIELALLFNLVIIVKSTFLLLWKRNLIININNERKMKTVTVFE